MRRTDGWIEMGVRRTNEGIDKEKWEGDKR